MKKILQASLIIVSVSALFASCVPPPSSGHFLSASSSSIGSLYSSGSLVTTYGAAGAKIVITGTAPSGAKMQVIINPYAGVTGTFALYDTTDLACQYTSSSLDTMNRSVHGTLTITSVTPDIIGSFTFTGRDSSIFIGSFNAPTP